jgi:prevent-host-death family protein
MIAVGHWNDYNDHNDHTERATMDTAIWTVAQAKAKLSEVLDQAEAQGPQIITRNGRKTAVIVSAGEWERRTQRSGSLASFFAASPLRGSGLTTARSKDRPRKGDL